MNLKSKEDFQIFYEKQAPKVRGLLFRLVGEGALSDLTQEAFMKAWEYRDKFRGESEASTWLFRISYNCAVDHLRRNKKREAPLSAELSDSLEKEFSHREMVDQALEVLDLEHRVVVILFYLEDQGIKDIALALEIPEGTVKSRLNQARGRMAEFFEKKGVRI